MDAEKTRKVLDQADLICDEASVNIALARVAEEIAAKLQDTVPLVLSVMGGGVVFTGQLLPLLRFPLEFDYVHVSRYRSGIRGGELEWIVKPRVSVVGRTILVIDDILDEGHTLAEIRSWLAENGAKAIFTAVFADKDLGKDKPVRADFVGVSVPDRYVFGFGMDVRDAWRNLPAIYALKESA